MSNTQKKPLLSFWQIWNISFGFLGVQIGYDLQNANISSIFLANGAGVTSYRKEMNINLSLTPYTKFNSI